ncbi:hypothetical protein FFL34_11660 [Lentibacillus cibarius]|uniref:Uncharacterized protein n=1 Tax=Lentibacillus cibarius TaxID=2583219 RepID=A0A5S3QLR2_9BACI|nr:hypothetical protein FFL34_11660 [Lentibacillus cibarius]
MLKGIVSIILFYCTSMKEINNIRERYLFVFLSYASKNAPLLQIQSMIKMIKLYSSYGKPLDEITDKLNLLLEDSYMLNKKDIQRLQSINVLTQRYENNGIDLDSLHFKLERMLVLVEHDSDFNNLLWGNSIENFGGNLDEST